MLVALIRLGLFGPIIISGTFTCRGTAWVSDGSKCYKTISGSPSDGQNLCSNEDPYATLLLAPNSVEANKFDTLFSGEKIWVGLRFRNGSEWIWDNGKGQDIWGSTPIIPQLCIGVLKTGLMFDYECYRLSGLICQKDIDVVLETCETGWSQFGFRCFTRLRKSDSGVSYSNAKILCSNENALVMMPQSLSESEKLAKNLDCGLHCWVGVTDFDADHTYTWENGTDISQSSLYFSNTEPSKRDLDYVCAYIQDGQVYNHACTTQERVICEKDAFDNSKTTVSTQMSTQTESTSAEIQITTYISAFKTTPTMLAITSTPLESTSDKKRTTGETSSIKTTPSTAFDNSQTTVSTQMSAQTESTSAEIQITTYTSAFKKTHSTIPTKTSTPYDVNIASGTTSTGPNSSTDDMITTEDKPVVQYDNATIMPFTFLGLTISASDVPCIIQCISNPSENINTNGNARPINIPYKVDLKSLSSYRRRYKSADDPRMSSFYIGCVGISVLVRSILFIIMLDCLPSA